jgi:hypothetical protein
VQYRTEHCSAAQNRTVHYSPFNSLSLRPSTGTSHRVESGREEEATGENRSDQKRKKSLILTLILILCAIGQGQGHYPSIPIQRVLDPTRDVCVHRSGAVAVAPCQHQTGGHRVYDCDCGQDSTGQRTTADDKVVFRLSFVCV